MSSLRTPQRYAFALFLLCLSAAFRPDAPLSAESPAPELARIVVLGDPHLPYKRTEAREAKEGAALLVAKEGVIEDINGWSGVARVVAVGDLVGDRGTEAAYRFASGFLGRLTAPLVPLTGNHDYIYQDDAEDAKKLRQGDAASRRTQLGRFLSAFKLDSLQREESLGGCELIYLCADSTDLSFKVGLSDASLAWLEKTLERTAPMPTIVFFHAPLADKERAIPLPAALRP